jgi:Txe/YoeB family toxin of Txe-Axe toxin-antitoxin module
MQHRANSRQARGAIHIPSKFVLVASPSATRPSRVDLFRQERSENELRPREQMYRRQLTARTRGAGARLRMTYSAIAAIAAVLGGCGDGSQQSRAAGHVCDRPFDSQAWFASKQGPERQRLAKRLVHCRDLIGKSKREVARVIGKPPRVEGTTKREYSRRWTYELGENDLIPPDSTTLEVVFDAHGKVRRVE